MVSGPLHETTQGRPATAIHICRTVSALGVKPKILSTKKKGLDASNDRGLTERSGEVFSLDILSHRMSEMTIFHQLTANIVRATGDNCERVSNFEQSAVFL